MGRSGLHKETPCPVLIINILDFWERTWIPLIPEMLGVVCFYFDLRVGTNRECSETNWAYGPGLAVGEGMLTVR